ncbi:MAG: protein translocase subunit SecD [Gemmataceae bacterium]|nr:protein translocase subunit SecD [Gemmataceae bacterium]MDW8264981.1 protein translocase subunit SecD [Gemmataceae bacterium]
MKPFITRIVICLVPTLAAVAVVVHAATHEGGFKLGVDLAGGTNVVYEVDVDKFPDGRLPPNFDIKDLIEPLRRRIDPSNQKDVTIRPVSNSRVEIVLPTGGGRAGGNFTPEEVEDIKRLISKVGSLEFRILANEGDDKEAIEAAKAWIDAASDANPDEKEREARRAELQRLAEKEKPPPSPRASDGSDLFPWSTPFASGRTTYSWVELGAQERQTLRLSNNYETPVPNGSLWWEAAQARKEYRALLLPMQGNSPCLLYSREFRGKQSPIDLKEQGPKKYEYFILVRDPLPGQKVSGEYLINAFPTEHQGQLAVGFTFNSQGGNLFYELTTANKPSGSGPATVYRHLAIIVNGLIESAPTINSPISTNGVITGRFDMKQVNDMVRLFKSGALPAALKPEPVSENTIGATLGEDTIVAGRNAIIFAFVAVVGFMILYYRFAGLVACIALTANLLLTVAFMVLVQASFTLPGLAGLVLMLGMAVDANVLIYERLREERDRGASLALALRNGYDRAFPTIIDTHLSSIFTAIVLYAVGNDQLKGFGVSLTVGLVISLFTSLYMTRLMFDIWLAKGWLPKLSMLRLLSKTNIDFMAIRYYWFTATVVLTAIGISVFLARGGEGLNIDFIGGTAYTGQLEEPVSIGELRKLLDRENQQAKLQVAQVIQKDDEGRKFEIKYTDGTSSGLVQLPNRAAGETKEERERDVARRASQVPDLSVEQIFMGEDSGIGVSRFFTVRTSEKAPDLVLVSLDRLLTDAQGKKLLKRIDMNEALLYAGDGKWVPASQLKDPNQEVKNPRWAVLPFSDFASPSRVRSVLETQFAEAGIASSNPFDLEGVTAPTDDPALKRLVEAHSAQELERQKRYRLMRLTLNDDVLAAIKPEQFRNILEKSRVVFNDRPQPERLENFDSQFAAQTQGRAFTAIVASWGAVLLYLWFRFGNWTFGLAAVLCLIHDLFLTLGIIAFCHYISGSWIGNLLLIQDFKIDLATVAALLTLVGYSVNDTIVVFDRIREVRGKNPDLTPQMINDSVNQTLSRTILTAFTTWLVVVVLYIWGGDGVHLFSFVMVVGVLIGTYSSIYIASPLLLIFGEGARSARERRPAAEPEGVGV